MGLCGPRESRVVCACRTQELSCYQPMRGFAVSLKVADGVLLHDGIRVSEIAHELLKSLCCNNHKRQYFRREGTGLGLHGPVHNRIYRATLRQMTYLSRHALS